MKIELPYDPAVLLLGINLEKMKTLILKDIRLPMFIAAVFIMAKIWRQPVSINRQMDKYVINIYISHISITHIYIISSLIYIYKKHIIYIKHIKKDEILPFAAMWMDLENIMLSEIRQTEKEKY